MTTRPLLLLDVGFAATGVAVATLHDDGPHVALDVIVPARGLSPKALHEKRACVKFGDLSERLFMQIWSFLHVGDPTIVAEVPVMGSRSAAGMRSMALALACYRAAAVDVESKRRHEFIRNDVLAACFPKKKPVGDGKAATRALVRDLLVVDDSRLPAVKTKADQQLHDNAYDAAALLFVAREHGILRECGWGDWEQRIGTTSAAVAPSKGFIFKPKEG